ncbi:MAG: hypothetical protein A3H27_10900 [Acidobacteria bacterium RIFCSPLOWO2_02_FULL_59_13]|nr:MAG: hypothetical protein A3H27_10900 [Acidobacteria bacterium RIFCSPLOWO2_02_FULL_59_13]
MKRLLIHVAAFNLSLVLRREAGDGTPRGLPGRWNRVFFCIWLVGRVLESLSESSCRQPATSAGRFPILPPLGQPLNAA